jgi:UDP-4-amino-4,6-dideoxy-N-acetyl-beta-L-altrosamine N-acetyltransferase
MGTEQIYSFTNFTSLNSDEVRMVWKWRNHDSIRKWMYNTSVIPFENHLSFLENLKTGTTKVYYLVKRYNVPLGVISTSAVENNGVDLGFYLGTEYLYKKLSVEFYFNVLKYVFEVLNFRKVIGYVLVENNAANSLNELFGFIRHKVNRTENGKTREYFYSELTAETWEEVVKTNKTILQHLESA